MEKGEGADEKNIFRKGRKVYADTKKNKICIYHGRHPAAGRSCDISGRKRSTAV
jgi:hypothetical protein